MEQYIAILNDGEVFGSSPEYLLLTKLLKDSGYDPKDYFIIDKIA
jgi:hypothetical protein